MDSLWQVVKVPAQRIGERLRFVVVVQASKVPPTTIVADLDQPRPELDTEQHPAQQQDDGDRRSSGGRAKEDRQKTRLQQERLPAEGVERLADVDDRQIQHPQHQPDQHRQPGGSGLRQTHHERRRQHYPEPRHRSQKSVGVVKVEEAGRLAHRRHRHEAGGWQQAVLAKKCWKLVGRDEKRDQVDGSEHALEEPTG